MSLSRTRTLLVQSAALNNFTKRLKNSVDISWRREANYDSQSAVRQETTNHRASHSNWVKILQSAIRRQATAVWGCVTHQILQVLPGVFVVIFLYLWPQKHVFGRRTEEFSSLVCCSENRYLDQKCLLLNQLSAVTKGKYEIKLTNRKLQQRNVRNVIS